MIGVFFVVQYWGQFPITILFGRYYKAKHYFTVRVLFFLQKKNEKKIKKNLVE